MAWARPGMQWHWVISSVLHGGGNSTPLLHACASPRHVQDLWILTELLASATLWAASPSCARCEQTVKIRMDCLISCYPPPRPRNNPSLPSRSLFQEVFLQWHRVFSGSLHDLCPDGRSSS